MVSAVHTSDLNLDLCAQEPIRIPGNIQPHGMLVVVDPDSRQIVQASANATALLGDARRASAQVIPCTSVFGPSLKRMQSLCEASVSFTKPDPNFGCNTSCPASNVR